MKKGRREGEERREVSKQSGKEGRTKEARKEPSKQMME